MSEKLNFWQEPEWIELKTSETKTEKILSKVEYLRLVGWQNFSEDNYRKYLETIRKGIKNE